MTDQQQQEPTEQEVRAVGDTDAAPAPEDRVAEHVRTAFYQGEGVDDVSAASSSEMLDDSQATGPSDTGEA